MKNIFIVTLGSREIQFNINELRSSGFIFQDKNVICKKDTDLISIEVYKNLTYPEFYCHAWPRVAGEKILDNFDIFKTLVHFPLIDSALKQILIDYSIDTFITVFTDQKDLNLDDSKQIFNYNRDTVFYKSILELTYRDKFPQIRNAEFIDIAIERKVSDIDFQYKYFADKCKVIFEDSQNIENIFLLAQGGIDQINHALTLQLIQAFGSKVNLWQQSEIGNPRYLEFTNHFLKDLIRNQVASLIDFGEYYGAYKITESVKELKLINGILEICHLRKHFLFKDAIKKINNLGRRAPAYLNNFKNQQVLDNEFLRKFKNESFAVFKTQERFHLAEFYFLIRNDTEFILSFQIFFETLVTQYLNCMYKINLEEKYQEDGNKLIRHLNISDRIKYSEFLLKIGRKSEDKLTLSFPVLTLFAIAKAVAENHKEVLAILKILEKINSMLNGSGGGFGLDCVRNKIAHRGIGANPNDLYCSSTEKNPRNKREPWQNYMTTIKSNMGLDLDHNPYIELNSLIKSLP